MLEAEKESLYAEFRKEARRTSSKQIQSYLVYIYETRQRMGLEPPDPETKLGLLVGVYEEVLIKRSMATIH